MPDVYYVTRQDAEEAVGYAGLFGAGGMAKLSDCIADRLDAALAAPRAGFGEFEKYETLAEKAGALLYGIAKGHPCPTGNKRLAFILTVLFLNENGRFLWCGRQEVTAKLEEVAASDPENADQVRVMAAEWIEHHLVADTEAQVRLQAGISPDDAQ